MHMYPVNTHISCILYYHTVSHFIFTWVSSGMLAINDDRAVLTLASCACFGLVADRAGRTVWRMAAVCDAGGRPQRAVRECHCPDPALEWSGRVRAERSGRSGLRPTPPTPRADQICDGRAIDGAWLVGRSAALRAAPPPCICRHRPRGRVEHVPAPQQPPPAGEIFHSAIGWPSIWPWQW